MGVREQTLAMMQRVTKTFLSDRCALEFEHETPADAFGDRSHVWQVAASDVPCRLIQIGSRTGSGVIERAAQEQMRDEYRLIVERTVALGVDYRVMMANGDTYQVVRIETELSNEVFHSAILNRRLT